MINLKLGLLVLVLLTLAGCLAPVPTRPEPDYQPVLPASEPIQPKTTGSIFGDSQFDNLFVDRRAFRVGDIVTVRLEERTSSSKSAETSVKKESSNDTLNPQILGESFGATLGQSVNALSAKNDFKGTAGSDQSNSLDGTLTVVVAEVYPNGLMRVRGEKWLHLNRGEEYLRLSGLLRSADIGDDNSVSSARLADARFSYSGTGELANSNAPGWLSRFFLSPKFPF